MTSDPFAGFRASPEKSAQRAGFVARVIPNEEARAKGSKDGDGEVLDFIISSDVVDRMGDVIDATGWELDNWRANPVVLWAHDSVTGVPVARGEKIWVQREEGRDLLMSTARFTHRDLNPFGHMIGRLYRERFLSAVSVGFIPLEWSIDESRPGFMPINFLRQELLEYSAVPIPANPEALVDARAKGIDTAPLIAWAEKLLDDAHGAGFWVSRTTLEATWRAVAPAQVQVPADDVKATLAATMRRIITS